MDIDKESQLVRSSSAAVLEQMAHASAKSGRLVDSLEILDAALLVAPLRGATYDAAAEIARKLDRTTFAEALEEVASWLR